MLTTSSLFTLPHFWKFAQVFTPPYFWKFAQVLWYCQKDIAVTVFGFCTHVISYSGNALVFYIAFRNILLQDHFNITFICVTCFILSVYKMLPHENLSGLLRSHQCNWRHYIPSIYQELLLTHSVTSQET